MKYVGVWVIAVSSLILAGCAIEPQPITEAENAARVEQDRAALFENQELIAGPVTLDEAIARALKYNLDQRLKLMEEAVSARQLDVAKMNLLPDIVANAGYSRRSEADTTFNETKTDTSTTSDKGIKNADLHASWNILDFVIGYVRAQQQADQALIVRERRRQVIHNIMQDVRAAYWRAAAAQRALKNFDPLLARVRQALSDSEQQIEEQVNRMDALVYQRQLLETLRQLEILRRDMQAARTELTVLMNVHPQSEFTVAAAEEQPKTEPLKAEFGTNEMELAALANRSELRSEAYQLRINQQEARVAILRMIPGLNFSAGVNYTSDSFKENEHWYDGSVALSWNLINLLSGPRNIDLAETRQELSRVRRLALSMAVIAQVNIAHLRYAAARRDFELTNKLSDVEGRILTQLENNRAANVGTESQLIQGEVGAALARLRRDLAYADMQAAFGRVVASVGADPLAVAAKSDSVADVAEAVSVTLEKWERGEFDAPLPEAASDAES